jgi:hypothetical protein
MPTSIFRLLIAPVIVMLIALHVMVGTPRAGGDNSRFIVFIHAGGNESITDDKIRDIAIAIAQKGYSVRPWDRDLGQVGGSRVDYFREEDAEAAGDVAAVVNEVLDKLRAGLKEEDKLKPRLRRVKNPPGYLGVWLF